ncbi:hypothetical protein LINPERPRIM_LOCUS33104 [Linum perenne]
MRQITLLADAIQFH